MYGLLDYEEILFRAFSAPWS